MKLSFCHSKMWVDQDIQCNWDEFHVGGGPPSSGRPDMVAIEKIIY